MNYEKFPAVIPVMELRLNATGIQNLDPGVIEQLRSVAIHTNSLPTPDGWFIPLADLKARMTIVAEFLLHETVHFGEFEIGGGFVILIEPGVSIGVPLSSSFRDAVNLANIVLSIGPSERRNFATGAQDFWTAVTNKDLTEIEFLKQGSKMLSVEVSLDPLRKEFRFAKQLLMEFANELGKTISRDPKWDTPLNLFRFMFGLDKFDEIPFIR
jgi:hypothetical protein